MTNKTPHIHAALIKEWADGAEIQFEDNGVWYSCRKPPMWTACTRYRVKPESKPKPKPDIVRYQSLNYYGMGLYTDTNRDGATIMFVFDGETGALKDAQVLAHE